MNTMPPSITRIGDTHDSNNNSNSNSNSSNNNDQHQHQLSYHADALLADHMEMLKLNSSHHHNHMINGHHISGNQNQQQGAGDGGLSFWNNAFSTGAGGSGMMLPNTTGYVPYITYDGSIECVFVPSMLFNYIYVF